MSSSLSTVKVSTNDKKNNNSSKKHSKSNSILQMHNQFGNQRIVSMYRQSNSQDSASANSQNALDGILSDQNPGSPMESPTRKFMESRFNYDFSDVRLHTDSKANKAVGDVNADAFTSGKDVYFKDNNVSGNSQKHTFLLAHELAHVVQQDGESSSPMFHTPTVETGDVYEHEANSAAFAVIENRPVSVTKKVRKNPIQRGLLDFAKSVGGAVFSGAKSLGGKLLEGAKTAGGALLEGAKTVGSAYMSGIKAAGGLLARGASWLAEKIPAVGKIKSLLKNASDVFGLIFNDPSGFLMKLLKAISGGFGQFFANIGTHLKNGLMGWLFGTMEEAGITLPEKFDLKGILGLILQVLGLTYDRLRAKAVKLIGEKNVGMIEQVWGYVSTLIKEGPQGLWEQMKGEMQGVISSVMDSIKSWIITTIIKKSMIKIASLFDPTFISSIVTALTTIYDVVTMVVEKMQQIQAVVESIINSVSMIAKGQTKTASDWIEKTLANIVPVAISFLASFVGLGGISGTIKKTIGKIQAKVDSIIDKVIDKVVGMFGGKKGKKGKKDEQADEMGADIEKELNKQPAPKKRNAKQKAEDLKKAERIADLIITNAKSTTDVEKYFERMKTRFRLKSIGWEKLGTPAAVLAIEINPKKKKKVKKLILNSGQIGAKSGEKNKPDKPVMRTINTHQIDDNGKKFKEGSEKVAIGMRVTLNHKHRKGKDPQDDAFPIAMKNFFYNGRQKKDFKKGHLLHDDLGGLGTAENMYPITNSANQLHRNNIESKVVDWVNKKGYEVNYRVQISGHKKDLGTDLPEITMKATAAPLDANGKEAFAENYTIGSKFGGKKDVSGGRNVNVTGGTGEKPARLSTFKGPKKVKWTDRTAKKKGYPLSKDD